MIVFYGDIEKDAFLNLNNKYLEDDEILRHLDPLQVFITVLIILTCSQFLGKVDDIPTKETRGRELTKNFLLLSNFHQQLSISLLHRDNLPSTSTQIRTKFKRYEFRNVVPPPTTGSPRPRVSTHAANKLLSSNRDSTNANLLERSKPIYLRSKSPRTCHDINPPGGDTRNLVEARYPANTAAVTRAKHSCNKRQRHRFLAFFSFRDNRPLVQWTDQSATCARCLIELRSQIRKDLLSPLGSLPHGQRAATVAFT